MNNKNKVGRFFSFGSVSSATDAQIAVALGVIGLVVAAALGAALTLVGVPWYVAPLVVAAFAYGRLGR